MATPTTSLSAPQRARYNKERTLLTGASKILAGRTIPGDYKANISSFEAFRTAHTANMGWLGTPATAAATPAKTPKKAMRAGKS